MTRVREYGELRCKELARETDVMRLRRLGPRNHRCRRFCLLSVSVTTITVMMATVMVTCVMVAVSCERAVIVRQVNQATLSYENRSQQNDPNSSFLVQSHFEQCPIRCREHATVLRSPFSTNILGPTTF